MYNSEGCFLSAGLTIHVYCLKLSVLLHRPEVQGYIYDLILSGMLSFTTHMPHSGTLP